MCLTLDHQAITAAARCTENLIVANQAEHQNQNMINFEPTVQSIREPVNLIVRLSSNIEDCSADYRIKYVLI